MAREDVCKVQGDKRARPQLSSAAERVSSFSEVESTFTLEQAMAEASRCTGATTCLYCEVCELMCPDLAITRDEKTGEIQIDLSFCKGCGLCAVYCPKGAIQMVVDTTDKVV